LKRITNYFLKGLLFMVPIALTLYIFYLIFTKIDNLLKIPIPGLGIVPGVGFIATLLLITVVGFLVSNFLTKKIMLLADKLLNNLPLVKLLYSSIKDLINAFVGDKKSFNKPVLVRLSKDGSAYALGFITCASLENLGLKDLVAVYIPQSYNFAGNLLLFPREQVQLLQVSSSEVMTFIVSGGVAKS
jgi:uncharacterized membrane protein